MTRIRVALMSLVLVLVTSPSFAQGSETVVYFHADAIGSTRLVTDANGQVLDRYDYLPFGEPYPPSAPVAETRRFGGKERDSETGLDYFGARYYASGNGRFTGPDIPGIDQNPLDPQSWNLYSYVRNNPLRFIDPDGRECVNGVNPQTGNFCAETVEDTGLRRFLFESWRHFDQQLSFQMNHRPWVVSWIVPIYPVPFIAGAGPAGTIAWNPETRTLCKGLGIGVSAGKTVSVGPLTHGTRSAGEAFPARVDDLLAGGSVSFGGNAVPLLGLGGQMIFNNAGAAAGPSLGIPGFSAAWAVSWCDAVR